MSLPWPALTTAEWYERIAATKKKSLSATADSSIINLDREYVRDEIGRFAETGGDGGDGDRGVGSTAESKAESIPAGKEGECFRNAARWSRVHDDFDLVHGKVTNGDGKTLDHAWAESPTEVADPTTGVKMDKDHWYGLVQAQPEAKYTSTQATRNMLKTGNFGPWTDEEVGEHRKTADKPPRRPAMFTKSKRERAAAAAERRRQEGGAVGDAQRKKDWAMARGREQQRIIRAIRKRDDTSLGSDKSGNYGHAGRPGHVGGSAPKDGGDDTGAGETRHKKDGGKIEFNSETLDGEAVSQLSQQAVSRVLGESGIATLEDMAAQMLADVPGELTVTWDTAQSSSGGIFFRKVGEKVEDHNTVIMKAESEDYLVIARTFTRDKGGELIVRHNSFKVPEGAQGKGVAKAFLKSSLEVYEAMGVDKIQTFANSEVGGYAWAKFGFTAELPREMAIDMTKRASALVERGTFTESDAQGVRAVIEQHKDDPKLPWHLAGIVSADGRALGKQLLLTSHWDATLSMDDPEAVRRLKHYVGAE